MDHLDPSRRRPLLPRTTALVAGALWLAATAALAGCDGGVQPCGGGACAPGLAGSSAEGLGDGGGADAGAAADPSTEADAGWPQLVPPIRVEDAGTDSGPAVAPEGDDAGATDPTTADAPSDPGSDPGDHHDDGDGHHGDGA